MSKLNTETHAIIRKVMGDSAMTSREVAAASGIGWMGVESAMKGMWRRGELSGLKIRKGEESRRYRVSA